MSEGLWGIWIPTVGPIDRPRGAWLRPIDEPPVDVAMVFRSRADAESVIEDQRRKFGNSGGAEAAPFDWAREARETSEAMNRG